MGLGNLLRSAADSAMAAAKDKAADLRGKDGNEAEVYESAVTAVGDAIADAGQMNSAIATIITDIAEDNPYK